MSRLPNLLRYHRAGTSALFPWLVIVLAGVLACAHLGRSASWDDEAQTGIIARNFLHTGQLTGWDGRNLFAYRNGALLNDQLRVIQPPVDILVTAGAFAVLGVSAWAGRLPFALAGILTLVLFWRLVARRFGANSARAHHARFS